MTLSRLLITGATGFIGSRLCERLTLHYRLPYRALARSYTRANRIARLNAEMVHGELLQTDSIRRALAGCDAVVHLAHSDDKTGPHETRLLLDVCRQAKIKRFVHVSSMAVHGPHPGPECAREDTATIGHYGEAYSDAKAASEQRVQQAMGRHGFPAVILRPTIVYGPYSAHVMQVIDSARRGEVSLINNGTGVCNTIYVDDVCDAIRAALTTEKALGQAFFITDDRAATWSEFILTFARMVEPPPSVRELTSQEILNHWAAQQPTLKSNLRGAGRLAVSSEFQKQLATVPAIGNSLRFTKRALRKLLTDDQALRLKQMARPSAAAAPAPSFRWPNKNRVMRETFPIAFRNDHAKSLLGWQPAYDLQRGAALTRTWLAFARMLQPYPAR